MEITVKEREMALDIINLLLSNGFEEALNDRPMLYKFNCKELPGDYTITISHGSTRTVIICDELENWVIKTNYYGSVDYCEIEANLFKEIKEQNLQYYFAETYFLAEVGGHKFYLQEKLITDNIERDGKIYDYTSEHYMRDRNEFASDEDYDEEVWSVSEDLDYDDIIECLMPEGYCEVSNFVDSHDLNDLHIDNYGMTYHGDFKLLDYCGYYE